MLSINRVGDAADAICCLPPGATLNDITKKFKWLYGSVESFDTWMQEFFQIVQGNGERVQTFVLHLEWALKVIKQQHPHAMTKEEGVKHLKDQLFHGLKPNIHNGLCYMYDKPDSQYSWLVIAARKVETETPGSDVPEVRAKSAVVGTDLEPEVASCDPPYEAITQQITYLMSAITNQNLSKNNECNGSKQNNGNGIFSDTDSSTKFQRPKRDRKGMKCWRCRDTVHSWRECSPPRQSNILPFRPANQNLNHQWGRKPKPPILSQSRPGRNQH